MSPSRDRPLQSLQDSPGQTILLDCLRAALNAVDARTCVRTELERDNLDGDWQLVAIGKAAAAMVAGAHDYLGRKMAGAIVITKPGHCPENVADLSGVSLIESAHPIPDASSLQAGRRLVDFVAGQPPDARLLFLISGGASSLVEVLRPGISLADLERTNDWALSCGRSIEDVNAVRRGLSQIKGGGLAALARPRETLALMISDVPGDDPETIGSGLLHPTTERENPVAALPAWIVALLDRAVGPREGVSAVLPPRCRIVASIREACSAAGLCGKERGLEVRYGRGRFVGDAASLGRRFARTAAGSEPGTLWVWGGESTVVLPPGPGRGGRNQHLALSAAMELAGRLGTWLMAAGTDGVDGSSDDAGALIDGFTVERGEKAGLDAASSLAGADSGRFLEAAGDLVHTGPTLTNVGDLALGLKLEVPA